MAPRFSQTELLIVTIARLLEGVEHVAVGASSPIPGSAAFLAQAWAGGQTRVTVLGSRRNNDFTDGGRELFDCAGQGRIGAFFLGGGQIDGKGNVNLVGLGAYPNLDVRFPGSFGSAYLYFLVPRVILFREEHSPRVLVPQVDFISAPGTSPDGVHRPGGPRALVTGRALFSFDKARARFRLEGVHPGETPAGIREATGFDYDEPTMPATTLAPDEDALALIRGPVRAAIAEVYPRFAAKLAPPEAA